MTDVNMRILLSATGGPGVISAVQSVASALSGGGGGLAGAIAGVGLAVGGMAIGLGDAAVNASSQFQTAMLANEAHAGLAASQVQNVTSALLQMGPAVGQGPTQLAQALYPVLSSFSGISDQSAKTQVSLAELKDAAESVAGSTTNVTSVTNAASAAFNAYGLATNDSATNISRMNNLFDIMNSTVSAGNMQWSNYSTVIGKLSVASHSAGVGFNEENAALADLTNSGYSAQLAGTYLSNTFTQLDLKTDSLDKNAKKLGISFDEQKFKSMSLGDQIRYLNQITDGNSSSILKLLNNNSVAAKTVSALSNSIGNYQSNLDSLNHSQGATANAFQIASQGFQFSMQKLQAAGQTMLITIGQQLLPTLTQLATNIAPIVIAFGNWLVQSGVLKNALNGVVIGITTLVAWGSATVTFFQHNQAAFEGLKIAAILLAGVIGGIMVSALVAMAVAAWAAIVPLLPFIAIGALVALAVYGIVEAVTHWGAIAHWLQGIWGAVVGWLRGVWQGFTSWLMGALATVGAFFTRIWNGILSVVHTVWNAIVTAVKIGVMTMVLIIFGPIIAIGALFVWLYNHNYYFKALIDAIVGFVKAGLAWLAAAWNTSITDTTAAWAQLSNFASSIWATIMNGIKIAVSAALDFLTSAWNTMLSGATFAWNQLAGFAQTAWSAVSSVFSSIWSTYLQPPLNTLWNQIVAWFDMADKLKQYGINAIQGFINGLLSMVSNVGNAGAQIAQKLAGFLGFHSPAKEGPGAELLDWPKNLIASYSSGLVAAIPQLQSSLNLVMQPVAHTLSGGASIPRPVTPLQGAGGGGTNYYITVNLSTMARSQAEMKRTVDLFEQELGQRFRSQTPQYASGGVF